jgi:hypothetical protein
MLPGGHIAFTWATLNLLQRRAGLWPEADYRLVALASLAPDLLDKPLALTLYRDTQAALFWGHNLWLHLGVWLGAWCVARVRGGAAAERRRRWRSWLPYLLAFSGHLIADRMWGFRESLFYPLGAGYWHPWAHVGEPQAMLAAYLTIVRTTPLLVIFELLGLILLGWVVCDRQLWRPQRLAYFLRHGRVAGVAGQGEREPCKALELA